MFGDLFSLSVSVLLTFYLLFTSQILFILVDINLKSNEQVMAYFKLKKSQLPALAIFYTPDEEHDVLPLDEFSVERVQDFCNTFLQRIQKVRDHSCTVYRKLGSCIKMVLLTRLFRRWLQFLDFVTSPATSISFSLALDLEQSRYGCVCRASLFIEICLLSLQQKDLSDLCNCVRNFNSVEASVFWEQQLGQ